MRLSPANTFHAGCGSFLSPDITDRREFTVQVDRRRGTNFDLRATASMFTNARLDATQLVSCDGTAVRNKQFLGVPEKLVPDVSGGATTCFRWPIQPRNSVRAKLGDRPRIEFGYDFAATAGGPAGPWLAELTAEDKPNDDQGRVRASNRVDRLNPGETLTANAVLALKP